MARKKRPKIDDKVEREVLTLIIRERAHKLQQALGEFSMHQLTEECEAHNDFDAPIPETGIARLDRRIFSAFRDMVRDAVKSENTEEGYRAWYPMSRDAYAPWRLWSQSTKTECRQMMRVQLSIINNDRRQFDEMRERHEKRFHEKCKLNGSPGHQDVDFVK